MIRPKAFLKAKTLHMQGLGESMKSAKCTLHDFYTGLNAQAPPVVSEAL